MKLTLFNKTYQIGATSPATLQEIADAQAGRLQLLPANAELAAKSRDFERKAQGYYLPYTRQAEFYVNGNYTSTGDFSGREPKDVLESVEYFRRLEAIKYNTALQNVIAKIL